MAARVFTRATGNSRGIDVAAWRVYIETGRVPSHPGEPDVCRVMVPTPHSVINTSCRFAAPLTPLGARGGGDGGEYPDAKQFAFLAKGAILSVAKHRTKTALACTLARAQSGFCLSFCVRLTTWAQV